MRLLLEYWWREYDAAESTYRVHMALLSDGVVLEDSRDVKPEGYFAHGRYPFAATTLYPRKGAPSASASSICSPRSSSMPTSSISSC